MRALFIQPPEIVLSIKPNYANLILSGQKTIELRRRFPQSISSRVVALIYSTAPTQAIIGQVTIVSVEKLPITKLWNTTKGETFITKTDFDRYFSGLSEGFALRLEKPKKFNSPIVVSDLVERFDFLPPQSFRYIRQEHGSLLSDERLQATH